MRQVILDTETTGLNAKEGHRIIEIGCVEVINRKITNKHFHHYVNPEREVEEGALSVHGITNEFLKNKPSFTEIVSDFIDFVRDAEVIIHNAAFDVEFINAELNLLKAWQPFSTYCRIVDSLAIARQLHVGQRNSLDALCKRYFIDNAHRELHGALLDAHLLARVYLAMTGGQATLFAEQEPEEFASQQLNINADDVPTIIRDLLVIKADDAELFAHEQHLQQIAEKGKCLWLEEDFV